MDTPHPARVRLALDRAATDELVAWIQDQLQTSRPAFDTARIIAERLGARKRGGLCEVYLLGPRAGRRRRVAGGGRVRRGAGAGGGALAHPRAADPRLPAHPRCRWRGWRTTASPRSPACARGTRERIGSFYSLAWRDAEERWTRVLDPLAASLPFRRLRAGRVLTTSPACSLRAPTRTTGRRCPRGDPVKLGPATNILQIHAPTATASMTLAGLTRQFRDAGRPRAPRRAAGAGGPDLRRLRGRAAAAGRADHGVRGRAPPSGARRRRPRARPTRGGSSSTCAGPTRPTGATTS